jgi:hypothetical protein
MSTLRLVFAGVLVGFGSQYATGNTKNDGFLGIPRFNFRSLISNIIALIFCMITVTF